ncbi:MAG TPA: ABC transporter substrate-binding protein [Longimicrobiaceae bacterium]|nr:ABC transporter substrate-binding protein [Longimicrobiaceae bacterium]
MQAPLAVRFLLIASFITAAACGDDADPSRSGLVADTATVTPGGTAVLAITTDMNQLMPLTYAGEVDGNLGDMIYMSLLRSAWEDGRVINMTAEESPMAIARSYEFVGPDSAAIRFHLRTDLRWSDGQPLTAEDVVWTYEALANPEVASVRQGYTESLDSIAAQNDSTVTFYFERRYPEMMFHVGHAIAPKHVFEGSDPSQLSTHPTVVDPAGNLVVSGPYQISDWQRGQQIVLTPNPYFEPEPNLDRIVMRVIPEETTSLVEFRTGNIDFLRPVSFDKVPQLREQVPDARIATEEARSYEYIAYNPQDVEAFADPDIRRALGLAIDVPAIIAALQMEEFAAPAAGPYSPIFEDLRDERLQPLPYDPEEARRILEAHGWVDTDGDGIREKDGEPFQITLVTNSGNQRRADVSQIVQQYWREVGVDAQLQQLEFNTFFDNLLSRNFDAALGGWQVALSADISGSYGPGEPININSYANPEVTHLMESALAQPTAEAAAPYWKDAAYQITQDQPYTWLYYYDQASALSNRLRGVKIDSYGAFQNAWEWWIPAELQRGAGAAPDSATVR